jgi:multiple sugar transport system permease protein
MATPGSRNHKHLETGVWWFLAAIALIMFLVPVAWMVSTSFKGPLDVTAFPPKLVFAPTFDNYVAIFKGVTEISPGSYVPTDPNFPQQLLNSAFASFGSSAVCLLLGAPAAYALSRLGFRGKRDIGFFVLGSRFVPPIAIVIPIFTLYAQIGMTNNLLGLMVLYVAMNVGFVVWLLKGFFDEVSKEIDESAMVEGCGRFGAFWRVVLPLALPGLVATAILAVLFAWNEFLFALVLTGEATTTATVGLTSFIGGRQIAWGSLCAAGTIVTLPVLALVLLTQKNLVRGFTGGAVRG